MLPMPALKPHASPQGSRGGGTASGGGAGRVAAGATALREGAFPGGGPADFALVAGARDRGIMPPTCGAGNSGDSTGEASHLLLCGRSGCAAASLLRPVWRSQLADSGLISDSSLRVPTECLSCWARLPCSCTSDSLRALDLGLCRVPCSKLRLGPRVGLRLKLRLGMRLGLRLRLRLGLWLRSSKPFGACLRLQRLGVRCRLSKCERLKLRFGSRFWLLLPSRP